MTPPAPAPPPNNDHFIENRSFKCVALPKRYVLGLMGFVAILNAYTMRVCLSIAITEMTIPSYHHTFDNNSTSSLMEECQQNESNSKILHDKPHIVDKSDKYDWTETQQGLILSSFYWGYILTHIPGGILAEIFGGKHLLGFGLLTTALLTLLTPFVVRYGDWYCLIALRVLQGFGEVYFLISTKGATFPALNVLLANWAPANERAKLGTLVYSGSQMGTVAANLIGGFLIQVTGHWSSVFYFFGTVSIIWFIFWNILCYNTPELDPFISEQELEYLKKNIVINKRSKKHHIPWSQILTSASVWALICAQIGHDWGFFTMISDLPKYLKDVLQFSIGQNGFYSAIPYLVMWICSILSACLCDWLISNNYVRVTVARKVFTTIASLGPSIGILLASYSGCDKVLAITCFIVSMGLMGNFFPGMKVNALDLSTNFSGTVMALVNGIGAITGIFVPYIAGVLTPNHLITEWRTVFWISFLVNVITNIIFVIFGSGKEQFWNKISNHNADGSH